MSDRLNLPEPIAAYFAADCHDVEAIARCFANDAVAKDEGHGFAKKKNADFQFYATVQFIREYLLK